VKRLTAGAWPPIIALMATMTVSVRPATHADVRTLADVLAKAFYDDPPFRWILPDDKTRLRRNRRLFTTVLSVEAMRHGAVDAAADGESGRILGAAIWFPPGTWPSNLPTLQAIRALQGYARALGRRLSPAGELMRPLARVHPKTPHWYLFAIGVDPAYQGKGVGGALLRSRLERVDRAAAAAYLESSKPENIPLYEHFGFETGAVPPLPEGAPVVTPMARPAR
jgi:ribosomal protein S18 acetylase RimI-like enzyme